MIGEPLGAAEAMVVFARGQHGLRATWFPTSAAALTAAAALQGVSRNEHVLGETSAAGARRVAEQPHTPVPAHCIARTMRPGWGRRLQVGGTRGRGWKQRPPAGPALANQWARQSRFAHGRAPPGRARPGRFCCHRPTASSCPRPLLDISSSLTIQSRQYISTTPVDDDCAVIIDDLLLCCCQHSPPPAALLRCAPTTSLYTTFVTTFPETTSLDRRHARCLSAHRAQLSPASSLPALSPPLTSAMASKVRLPTAPLSPWSR